MFVNKKVLATAIVGVLFAGTASAATPVDISATTPVPAVFASETVIPSTGLVFANAANALDLVTKVGYAFSDGEVRQARIECSDNMKFTTATVTLGGAGASAPGSVNGIGTNAIYFSITDDSADTVAASTITVTGTRTLSSTDPVSCTYGLYDTPSQASHGGETGRIVSATGNYIKFASSYALKTTSGSNTADVEADPAFSEYDGGGDLGEIGSFSFALSSPTVPLDPNDGAAITLGDILKADTSLKFHGDFSLAVDNDGDPDPNLVFLDYDGDCDDVDAIADDLTGDVATFEIGPTATAASLCYQSVGGEAIPVADYTVALSAVAADSTKFKAPDIAEKALGSIVHNGTELQAPLVNVPTGWISRLALTNTGSADRAYTISVQSEDGVTIDTANTTGVIKANSTAVIDNLNTVLTKFSTGAKARATLNVSVAAPKASIQGQYQLVSPEGSLSNYILVRPGTN